MVKTYALCSMLILNAMMTLGGVPEPVIGGLAALEAGVVESGPDKSVEGTDSFYVKDVDRATWDLAIALQAIAGRSLVDIEVYGDWYYGSERYSGIFLPVTGTIHTLTQGTPSEWSDFINMVSPLNGRFLDLEVGYFYEGKLYSAIFLEDGDDYSFALRTTNTESQFQAWLDQYLREGRNIIDFEAYEHPTDGLRYAGVWVDDPNQPRTVLYYHLEADDIDDLLQPLAGRLIDFETYHRSGIGDRYAVIMAMYPEGGWASGRQLTTAQLDDLHDSSSNAGLEIVDLERYWEGGQWVWGALWGQAPKSLLEVDAMPSDFDPESLPLDLSVLIADFESADQGVVGIYAKNFRTGQSLSYRSGEPFYLASSAKVPIHIKFWQEIEAGRLNLANGMPYTNCSDCRDNWYVDERAYPGFDNSDFGFIFDLDRFDRAMMQVSDNGATSALVDDLTFGLSHDNQDLNEWLSGVSGVGRGWWPVTSIHDVDRTIIWQGQVVNYTYDTSFFTVPGWAFEPWWRSGGTDTWGDLSDWLGNPATLPRTNGDTGHERYYSMGLNSATPKAFVLLLEGFWQNEFLTPVNTRIALARMTEWTSLDDQLPAHVDVWAKGGVKGGASHPVSDTAIIEMGPDAVGVVVLTKDNTRTTGSIRSNYTAPAAREIFEALVADLEPDMFGASVGPLVLEPGQVINISTDIENSGGGDCATSFDVTFVASIDSVVSPDDALIGTTRMVGIPGGTREFVNFSGPLPISIPSGFYFVGLKVDSSDSDPIFGEIGEQDEGNNTGVIDWVAIEVLDTLLFADGFESGDLGAWQ